MDDDPNKGFYHQGKNLGLNHIGAAAKGDIDSEPDIFIYNFNGYVGKFVFDKNEQIFMMPKSDVRIEPLVVSSYFQGFIATTPDGTKYYFGLHPTRTETAGEYTIVNGSSGQTTSWFLTRIASFDDKNFIDFQYIDNFYKIKSLPFCLKTGYYQGGSLNFSPSDCPTDPYETTVRSKILSSISSSFTSINFAHFDRTDLFTDKGDSFSFIAKGIDKISVQNGNFCVEYDLTQSYFIDPSKTDASGKRLKLDQVQKKACNSALSEPAHIFEYYGTKNPDGTTYFPHHLSKAVDHWNFPNGNTFNDNRDNLIP